MCTAESVLCVQPMVSIHRRSSRFTAVFGDLFFSPPETSNMFRLSLRYHVLLGSAVTDNRFTRTLSPCTYQEDSAARSGVCAALYRDVRLVHSGCGLQIMRASAVGRACTCVCVCVVGG